MGNYVKEAFKRINIRQISSFIMSGSEACDDAHDYDERLNKSSEAIINRLKTIYPDEMEFDDAMDDFTAAVGEYEDVFTEIGIKIGVRLLFQLLCNDE